MTFCLNKEQLKMTGDFDAKSFSVRLDGQGINLRNSQTFPLKFPNRVSRVQSCFFLLETPIFYFLDFYKAFLDFYNVTYANVYSVNRAPD